MKMLPNLSAFALGLALLAACGKKSESLPVQNSSEPPLQRDLAKDKSEDPAEAALNTPMNEQHEYLRLTLENSTDGDIDETAVVFGKHSCTFGIVGIGASKGYLGWPYSVDTNAIVRWRDAAKVKREARVEVSKIYDPTVEGELLFTIAGTNVTVKFSKIDQK